MTAEPSRAANILIVDDTVENLRLLTGMLGEQGYEARSVTSGRQAIRAAEQDPPDLILLDINMPDMSGYEVCRHLKRQDAFADVPVIFLTALSEVADKVKAFAVGGVDYVTKPFQLEEVHARVRTHLALRHARLDLKRSYQRLRELEKLRDDLVHMVVHDMRSPLQVLVTHLGLLEGEINRLGQESVEDLEAAVSAARVLTAMANDLLDVRRLEEGKMPVDPGQHDIAGIAESVRARMARLDRGRSIEIDPSGEVVVTCDADLVRRVLENLVGNAIKHTPPGRALRISVARRQGSARVAVADDGPGIPPEARQRIFDKFATIPSGEDAKYHSVGLGLAFCKLAILAHGGTIGVESELPRGSTFWFELPA